MADAPQHAGARGKPAKRIERGRHGHGARSIETPERRPDPIEAAECGGNADRAASVAAQCEVTGAHRRGCRRAARGAAGEPARGTRIHRGAVVGVRARDAIEKLVTHRLPDDRGAGIQELVHGDRMLRGGPVRREPLRTSQARALAGDIVHVLDGDGEPGQRARAAPGDRGTKIVRDERATLPRRDVLCHRDATSEPINQDDGLGTGGPSGERGDHVGARVDPDLLPVVCHNHHYRLAAWLRGSEGRDIVLLNRGRALYR